MAKFVKMLGREDSYLFECAACLNSHWVNFDQKETPCWFFVNRDIDSPTVTPSIRVSFTYLNDQDVELTNTCHFFIKNGMQEFCGDCTHELANQTVEIPE